MRLRRRVRRRVLLQCPGCVLTPTTFSRTTTFLSPSSSSFAARCTTSPSFSLPCQSLQTGTSGGKARGLLPWLPKERCDCLLRPLVRGWSLASTTRESLYKQCLEGIAQRISLKDLALSLSHTPQQAPRGRSHHEENGRRSGSWSLGRNHTRSPLRSHRALQGGLHSSRLGQATGPRSSPLWQRRETEAAARLSWLGPS